MRTRTAKATSIRISLTALLLTTLTASVALGQQWAKDMFDKTSHDFGMVARGAKVEHRFVLENIYVEDAHIASVSSSCGCTVPEISKRLLKTWEKTEIIARIDTRGYYGRKDATLTVVFDQPFPAEVQLNVHTYIRSDVVVQPGSVQFGTVVEGTGAERKLTISYAGRPDWEIQKVETQNPHLEAEVVKAAQPVPGQATFELTVKLKPDAPVGYIRDQLVLVTNDLQQQANHVPIAVEGVVVSEITVSPSPLLLGAVNVGQSTTGRLVVRGVTPFQIVAARSSDPRFQCAASTTAKPLHLIPVTFTADQTPGKIEATIVLETDLPGNKTLEVPVFVQVVGQTPTG
ncbi:MAG TPA: DUF1573 domain-containing protein [Thermoguttaceae bacterium]|nr:DUF1573 domain-containing protein [Thermoguttaceae bacterium]